MVVLYFHKHENLEARKKQFVAIIQHFAYPCAKIADFQNFSDIQIPTRRLQDADDVIVVLTKDHVKKILKQNKLPAKCCRYIHVCTDKIDGRKKHPILELHMEEKGIVIKRIN